MVQTLIDPTNEAAPAARTAAPRLESLGGKTIALLDISKARGDVFLDRVEERIASRGANVLRFTKPTFSEVVYVRHPIQDRTDDEMADIADQAVDSLVSALTN
ncbi:MAG: hypothetical protein OXU63_02890 [Acidobacteriota bacterium]|nr:hypothetical protein [Acidobacteriota bacterium]